MKTRSSILAWAAIVSLGTGAAAPLAMAQQHQGAHGSNTAAPRPETATPPTNNPTPAASERPAMATDAQLEDIRLHPETAPDRLFVLGAGHDNLWEQKFSELVQRRSTDPQVRDLAKHIHDDHRAANDKLRPVAERLNITLPERLPAEKQAKIGIFESLSPEQLDKVYLSHMKAGHAKAVTSYADQQQLAKSRELNQYVSETLPTLRSHADAVNRVAQAKGITGAPAVADSTEDASKDGANTVKPKANEDARTGIPAPGAMTGEGRE